MLDLAGERILLTGGSGFLGSHVTNTLRDRGCQVHTLPSEAGATPWGDWRTSTSYRSWPEAVWIPRSATHDLTSEATVRGLMMDLKPTVVIHLAALCGGIGANRARPGEFYYKNLVMGAHLMEYARRVDVKKFVAVGSICAYPKNTSVPFKEDDIWLGYPEETNAPYGIAKKAMLVQADAYRAQYGFNAIYLLPVNMYGPGDNFDLDSSHVIPALIKKFIAAKESGANTVEVWGTGTPTREFLYIEDAAEAIVLATERLESPEPVNIGSGHEVSIRGLVEAVRCATGYAGNIAWNTEMPDGQQRRCLDTSRAEQFGFRAKIGLSDGLKRTVDWYRGQSGV